MGVVGALLGGLMQLYGLIAYVLGFANVELRRRMALARTYTQWKGAARLYDNARGFVHWRAVTEDERLFNVKEVLERTHRLRAHVDSGDAAHLLQDLQYDFHRHMCGIHNPPLFTTYPSGTKIAVRELVSTIVRACDTIKASTAIPRHHKYSVLTHIQRAYGTSALVMSSNAALGAFQVGVVKALHEAGILPRVLFGSGSGAIIAAFAACKPDFSNLFKVADINFSSFDRRGQRGSLSRKVKRLMNEGTLMDVSVLLQFAKDNLGEMTFLEAFRATGRVLNVQVETYHKDKNRYSSWLLNHLTAPDVLVYTAAVASCATYGVYSPVDILQRMPDGTDVRCCPATLRWSASLGGFHPNDALERMRSLFGITNFIVSEASISRLPFITLKNGGFFAHVAAFFVEEFWRAAAAVSRLKPFQSRLTGVLQTYTKDVAGDVVVYPVQSVGDMLRLLRNPNQELLDYCMWRGEQAVWPHLERLRAHLVVEQALHEAVLSAAEPSS